MPQRRMDFRGRIAHDGGEYSFTRFFSVDLLLLLLEAAVALALLLGIVWWTWPRAREKKEKPDAAGGERKL
jgi:hypothetical protein